jgi:hypothetical protein
MKLILYYFFEIKLFVINDKSKMITISKKIKYYFSNNGENLPIGTFFGYWYFGNIINTNDSYDSCIEIYISQTGLNLLLKKQNQENDELEELLSMNNNITNKEIIYINCHNRNNYLDLSKRTLKIRNIPTNEQDLVINDILNFYKTNNNCTALICGINGTGKSYVAFLLAANYNSYFVGNYDPTSTAENIEYIYSYTDPKQDKPLIIILDEIDVLFDKIQNPTINTKYIPYIRDKTTWNTFLDNMKVLYPNVILILTSNLLQKDLNTKYDKSYLRNKRIDYYYEMKNQII